MKLKTYYKCPEGKLRVFEVDGVETVANALADTHEALKAEYKVVVGPVFGLIQGGKNG